ncbi:MAG: nucleotidyl transferase AbiEii/AbiGii toxin family protein [Methanotrichaceae archaeon]|nr:nucleotidyl transferase AbiEii/AbiGii toxin family protein [Methanotrichaceae archaeon]
MKSEKSISNREEVEEILKGLGERLNQPVQVLIIGGAAMLEYGLKDVTKDIDLVCRDASGKARLLEAARSLGFEVFGPEKRHARLGLDRIAVKGGHTLDIFAGRVSYDFGLSETVWQRGKKTRILGEAEMRYAAVEDIFILKLIANRPRDVEDCVSLASAGMDYAAVYAEIEAQYAKVGTVEEKIWITYLEEGIGKLEEDYRVQVPIADKVSELADEYRERLYEDIKSRNRQASI